MTFRELIWAAKNDEPLSESPSSLDELVMAFARGPRRSPVHFTVVAMAVVLLIGIGLVQLSVPGKIHLTSDPSGATVLVDGKEVGATPLSLTKVGRGDHKLELRKAGYEVAMRYFGVSAGAPSSYSFELSPVRAPEPAVAAVAGPQMAMLDRGSIARAPTLTQIFSGEAGVQVADASKAKKKSARARRR